MKIISELELVERFAAFPVEWNGPRVVAGSHAATPWHALAALDSAVSKYRLYMMNAPKGIPTREGVTHEASFIGPGMRGHVDYYPCHLSMIGRLLWNELPPDIVIVQTSKPRGRKVSLGVDVSILASAIRYVREHHGLLVAEINERMPYTFGAGEIYVDAFDYGIEVDYPLPEIKPTWADDATRAIARNVACLVPNYATIQGGIGAVVDTTMAMLDGEGYRVFTELGTDWVMKLDQAGKLNPEEQIVMTFAFGSSEFYRWLDGNPRVHMMESTYANDPGTVEHRGLFVSINTAFEVDLFDQANAFRIKGDWYSGFGGALDFTIGAEHSFKGISILALPSWREKQGVSCIVPRLTNPTTTMQHTYVVTEYGVAKMFGATAYQQAERLISIAHPSMRGSLKLCHAEPELEGAS